MIPYHLRAPHKKTVNHFILHYETVHSYKFKLLFYPTLITETTIPAYSFRPRNILMAAIKKASKDIPTAI